jgi:hypothetical protein
MVFLVLMLLSLGTTGVLAATVPPAAAAVNGVRLETWEADRELAQLVTSSTFHRRIPPERMREFRQEALETLIIKELKSQWFSRQKLEVEGEEAGAEWRKVRDRFDDETAYLAALSEKGITDEAFRRAFERDAVAQAVDRLVQDRVADPTDEDVVFRYLNHKADYTLPESRHVVHLLLYVSPSATVEEREKAEKRAAQLSGQARSGESLEDLVQGMVKDLPPKYREQVGDLGFIHRGTLIGGLDDAVFSAQVGEIVGPVKSLFGYHIFQVQKSRAGGLLPFEEVRESIVANLKKELHAEALASFQDGLAESAGIETGAWVEQGQ